jgi:phenylalanine-4-hydroxylase
MRSAVAKVFAQAKIGSRSFAEATNVDVPWFPLNTSDLDHIGRVWLDLGGNQEREYECYTDQEYMRRKEYIVNQTKGLPFAKPVPRIQYTDEEKRIWKFVYNRLRELHPHVAHSLYLKNITELESLGILSPDFIPQIADLNAHLMQKSRWRVKVISSILSHREFLNTVAHRTFVSTQYLRHPKCIDFSPEPDFIHECLGHIVLWNDPQWCDWVQQLAIASLGATDETLETLGSIYWYTGEVGMAYENGKPKFFGGAVASSYKELTDIKEGNKPFLRFTVKDLPKKVVYEDPQAGYYVGDSLEAMQADIMDFVKSARAKQPFDAKWDNESFSFKLDRQVNFINAP